MISSLKFGGETHFHIHGLRKIEVEENVDCKYTPPATYMHWTLTRHILFIYHNDAICLVPRQSL